MRELDEALIRHFKKQSKDIKNKDIIPVDGSFKFKKVAFDRFKVFGDHYDGLWKIEEVSGIPHLVRASDPKFNYKTSGDWSASADYDNSNITLFYIINTLLSWLRYCLGIILKYAVPSDSWHLYCLGVSPVMELVLV